MAAYLLLTWDEIAVEFVYKCKVKPTIDMPLTEILMNVALFRDMKLIPDPPSEDRPDEFWQS